jgi:AcrR family transcriptional regulator
MDAPENAPQPPHLRWVRPPQQARSQETLDRILDAAEALVTEKGFEDATVADVARGAESSVGAFYARFRDKNGLLYALYERYLEQAMATADAALAPARWDGIAIPEILRSVVRFLVEVYRERAGLIRAFVVRNHSDHAFRARQERLSHHVNAGLSRLLVARAAEIAHPDPARAAAFGLTMTVSTIESVVLFGELRSADLTLSDDELAAELARSFLAYLGVADPGSDAASRAQPNTRSPAE